MGLQVTEEDINTLKLRLEKAFGEEYEVEVHKEVSDLMGSSKETYDLVIFYHGDAICGVEYKYKAGGSFFYDRLQDLYINRLKKVGLKLVISGRNMDCYCGLKIHTSLNLSVLMTW